MIDRPKPKLYTGQPWRWCQPKRDGFRLTFDTEKGEAWGSDLSPHLEYTHRYPRIKKLMESLPKKSILDGELCVPGEKASSVATALRDESLPIEFATFAAPRYEGSDLIHMPLPDVLDIISVPVVPIVEIADPVETLKNLKSLPCEAEGIVLKCAHWSEWYKLKLEHTIDAVIVGVKEGRGRNAGLVGSLIVACEGQVIASVGGMTDDERLDITTLDNDDKLVGLVVEVKYQYVGARGKLRHPRFVRFRPDKPANECTLSQLEDAQCM